MAFWPLAAWAGAGDRVAVYRVPTLALALVGCAALGCWHFPGLFGNASAPILYGSRCATCHGDAGRGDGPGGAALEPRPRDFANAEWQKSTSDARIAQTIRAGGAAVGLSPFMPPQPDLSDRQLRKLVGYIREVGVHAAATPDERSSASGR